MFESDEDRTWFLVRLPVHERASLAETEQDTGQDKSLINKKHGQDTPQDTPQDVGQVSDHVEQLVVVLTRAMSRARIQAALEFKDRHHFPRVVPKARPQGGAD